MNIIIPIQMEWCKRVSQVVHQTNQVVRTTPKGLARTLVVKQVGLTYRRDAIEAESCMFLVAEEGNMP